MTEALRQSLRQLAAVVAIAGCASVALGVALGVLQGESVLRWTAYMLYIAGALVLGFAFLTGAPASPRRLAKQRVLERDQARREGREAPPEAPSADEPFASELVVLTVAGAALFGVGILLELAF